MNLNQLRSRLCFDWPVLDVHVHPPSCFDLDRSENPAEDARRLSESGDRAGVQIMCLFSLSSHSPRNPSPHQFRQANNYVLCMREMKPDRFLPFCYVNPAYPNESVTEIDRCIVGERMCGIKLWVTRRAVDPGLDLILERAVALGVPVLQHAWMKTTGNLPGESFPTDVANLAQRYPDARIIMAHLNGCGLRGLEEIAAYTNIYVDTSGGDPESLVVETAVAVLGSERVVFGSDVPIRNFGTQLGKSLGTNLSYTAKQNIIWNNAARILPKWANIKPLEEGLA